MRTPSPAGPDGPPSGPVLSLGLHSWSVQRPPGALPAQPPEPAVDPGMEPHPAPAGEAQMQPCPPADALAAEPVARPAARPPARPAAPLPDHAAALPSAQAAAGDFARMRRLSLLLAAPLSAEDQSLQSMPDASPTKWHLAHTTWFAETLLLQPLAPGYAAFDARWGRLFNSYYESLGPRHPRPERGLLSRPSSEEVLRYRAHVDLAVAQWLQSLSAGDWLGDDVGPGGGQAARLLPLLRLAQAHEEQHQELILTDILHALSRNPLEPAYRGPARASGARAASSAPSSAPPTAPPSTPRWLHHPGGLVTIGTEVGDPRRFVFDNEGPRHRAWLPPFEIAARPVSCGEFIAFIDAGGYRNPAWWTSDGWAAVQAQGWQAPLYWRDEGNGRYSRYTLDGRIPVDPADPVCHVSWLEAAAFAAWAGARLPTEAEWEVAWSAAPAPTGLTPQRLAQGPLHAHAADPGAALQPPGKIWEWTASSYSPYPGFRPFAGVASEYNGKFMVGQMVLRGGSWATPAGHVRPSYRNFFPPSARWQFSGLRLARDA